MKLDKSKIFARTKEGATDVQIAAELGASRASITRAKASAEYLALEAGASSRLLDDISAVQKRVLSWIVQFIDQVEKERGKDLDFKLKLAAVLSKYVNFSMEISNNDKSKNQNR